MEESPHYSSDAFIPFASNISGATSDQVPEAAGAHFRERHDFGQQRNKNILGACCNVSSSDAPWKRSSKYSFGLVGLHEEINDFFETMSPKEQENELRLKVIEHITRVVHSLWPQAQIEIFGSFRTGLYLPSSDIDMVIFGEWTSLPLSTLGQALVFNGILNSDINIIANATVPIIRLVHSPSGIRVDISFNMANGVESAKLVKKMMKQHPALPRLVLILKQFLVHRGLNEVYNGGMSSYCLTLLIVSFLQGYHKPNFEPSANFGAALLEFFEHYGVNFNYEKVSIHFQSGGLYKPRRGGGNLLSVEDPLVSGHDVAKGTYLMNLLKMSFRNAFYLLSKAVTESIAAKTPVSSYLHLILKVDVEVLTNREMMLNNHSKIMKLVSKLIEKLDENQSGGSASTSSPRSTPKTFHKKKKFGWRSNPDDVTGGSPPELPSDLTRFPCEKPSDTPPSPIECKGLLKMRLESVQRDSLPGSSKIEQFAKERIKQSSERTKTRHNPRAKSHHFKVGDEVWVKNTKQRRGLSPKLKQNREGPYTIVNKINHVLYRVQRSPDAKPKVSHINRLAPYRVSDHNA